MKTETFKKRFGDDALQIPKGFDGIDSKMMKAKNGKTYMIHFNSKGFPVAKEIKLKNVDILESFRDRFEFTNDNLKWILDGKTTSMMTSDKDGVICNIKFDENNLPIVTENVFDSNMLHSNITIKGSIIRHCNDSKKLSNKITDWLKYKFNIKF